MPADLAVVADLHQVVDLGARADARRLEGAAINRRAGADLDVVADLDAAQLRHLDVLAVLKTIAETIGAEHGVGVDDDAVAEDRAVVENDVRMQDHIVAEPAIAADDDAAVKSAAGAENAALADDGERMKLASGTKLSGRMDDGARDRCPAARLDGWPCRCCTMATKAVSGSLTSINVSGDPVGADRSSCRRAGRAEETTAVLARHFFRWRRLRSLSMNVMSSGPASFMGRAATICRSSP